MKYDIGDIVYASSINRHALITNYLKDEHFPKAGILKYQLFCLEAGTFHDEDIDKADDLTVKVA